MAIEVEFFGVTGMLGFPDTGMQILKHAPSTGLNGEYDIALDPTDGPAQRLGYDFGVTHMGDTGAFTYNLANSDIKDVLLNTAHGVTAILTLRVVYNYEP